MIDFIVEHLYEILGLWVFGLVIVANGFKKQLP